MKQFLIVISIIVLVSLPFLYPSIIEDASFNDHEYLQKLRRTRSDINTDNKDKGWQEDGTFKSWYQKGNGSENDKALNNLTSNKATSTPDSKTPQIQSKTISQPTSESKSTPITKSESKPEAKTDTTNILPYLLLVLLLIVVIVVIYIKYYYV